MEKQIRFNQSVSLHDSESHLTTVGFYNAEYALL